MVRGYGLLWGVLAAAAFSVMARAERIADPVPEMSWGDLMGCKLVVVGKYQSDKDGVMMLKVERVLRAEGKEAVKAGDAIPVKLEHWWTVQPGPVGINAFMDDVLHDGTRWLCYKWQMDNPGPLVTKPLVEAKESAVYFFPEMTAALNRGRQVMPAVQADGWQQALDKVPMDLAFRLGQGVDKQLEADGVEELKNGRDGKVIDLLLEKLLAEAENERPTVGMFHGTMPLLILSRIGDKNGDVCGEDRAKLPAAAKMKPDWLPARLMSVMAAADPERALKEFKGWMEDRTVSKEKRIQVIYGLVWTKSETALDLLISLITDKELGDDAIRAVRMMVVGQSWPQPEITDEERAKLRKRAKETMTELRAPANLSDDGKTAYLYLMSHDLVGDSPPK